MRILRALSTLTVLALGALPLSERPVVALPLSPAAGGEQLATLGSALPAIEVRNNGAGIAAGIIGGMIMGGIIASQPHYYPPYYYSPYAYYPAYRPYPLGGAAVAYCAQRFKSYDPYSMTYLGYDGHRHSCP
jgi:BA14K-like protein